MIRLFVAEKPSVARDLARVLGAGRKGDIHLDGDGVRVTWCIGHLLEVATPDAHDPKWKAWDAALLPILPRTLLLEPAKKTKAHLARLVRLLRDPHVGEVINACDAGREGELIFRYVYQHAGCTKPVRRFWVSSLTPQAIRAGLAAIRPGAAFDPLGAAARCRAEADWLVGMNGTRGLTALGSTLLSVGRVQTPTLAMVVEREAAIRGFVPTPYWEVQARLAAEAGEWVARYVGPADAPDAKPPPEDAKPGPDGRRPEDERGRLPDEATARRIAAALDGATGAVTRAERDRQTVPPPMLHHLTSLQRLANRRLGFTAARTLRAAQALYERHKLITYPRTDSRHLTRDVAAGVPAVLQAIAVGPWAADARRIAASPAPLGKRFVDDAQVGDHHAIIPTAERPDLSALGPDERALYELVVRRLLAALSPPAIYARTRLVAEVEGHRLEARGRVRLEPGWEAVDPPRAPGKAKGGKGEDEAEAELPPVEVGDRAAVREARFDRKETRPPPRFSEATLLGAMERAGRDLDDAALRAAMRDVGLGTPATRASILETLLRRDYLAREGRTLVPTPAGEALVGALPVETLKSPRLTAEWEQRLDRIARGEADPMVFRRDIRRFVQALVDALAAAPPVRVPVEEAPRGRGRGKRSSGRRSGARRGRARRSGGRASGARTARGARSRPAEPEPRAKRWPDAPPSPPSPAGPPSPPAEPARGAPRPRAAPTPALTDPVGAPCPRCCTGRLIAGRRGWGCARWREGCDFVLWFAHEGVPLPPAEAARLLRHGRTGPFTRRDGRPAGLAVDRAAPGRLRWVFGPDD